MSRVARLVALSALALGAAGCLSSPTPLAPGLGGSIGLPHHGSLTGAIALPDRGEGFVRFRKDAVKWGVPRLVTTVQNVSATVHAAHPGTPPLVVGDLSMKNGGENERHRSHRSGRDVDLVFFAMTPDGRPVQAPGFTRFGPDGLGKPDKGTKWLRFDVAREWTLVKALVESPDANVQWIFIARWLEALVVEWALAKGEDPELVWQAEVVMKQPGDSAAHDDHIHVRLACTPDEAVAGCEGGPRWSWMDPLPSLPPGNDAWLADVDAP